ncbi:MAG: MFS transporter [Planctomycetota bacterium]|nr:MFS transporter [Planctomycetota bacterium]
MFERYTAFFHLRAVAGQGALGGILILNEYVLRKQLDASRWEILLLLGVPASLQLMTVVWNPATSAGPLARRPFRTLGIGLHALLLLPLLTGGGWPAWALVTLLVSVLIAQMLLVPIQNEIVARNYGEVRRGRRFGRAAAVQSLFIIGVSFPAGLWLDHDPTAWPWAYAFAALAGTYGYRQWSRLRRRRAMTPPDDLEHHASAWQALRRDRTFLAFEGCFMVYGLGFLALQPVLPLYLVDELDVSYTDVGIARGAIFWSVMVFASPFVGRLGDRLGILKLGAMGFFTLGLFPLTLWLLPNEAGLFLGFAIFGLAMSAVNVTWNLGPITMARGRDPVPYLNAHISLVGIRALVGMTGATLLHQAFGTAPVFLGVFGLEIVAAGLMLWLAFATGRGWRLRGERSDVQVPRPPR